jgi:hypothetical protein
MFVRSPIRIETNPRFFDWFGSNPWPSVVGVQSAQNSSTNSAGGGNDIPNMVNQARSDFP